MGALSSVAVFLAVAPIPANADEPAAIAEELTAANWERLVPNGKEVDAIYGDTVLQNDYLRAVIAKPGATRNANMTVRNVGGCLIDLTSRDHESDQLSAFYPARRTFVFGDEVATTLSQASATVDGLTATVTTGYAEVRSTGTDEEPVFEIDYSLSSNDRFLEIQSIWTNTTKADITLTLEDDLRADAGKEDMPKAPNGTHELFWFHDIYWQQAYGIHVPGFRIRCNSNARESVLAYEPLDGKPVVIKPGESFSLLRLMFVAKDLPTVLANYDHSREKSGGLARVELSVVAGGKPVTGARVALKCGDDHRGTVVTGADGTSRIRLPVGECVATVIVAGKEFEPRTLTISRESTPIIDLTEYTPGIARITITDFEGRLIPAKVEFRGNDETPTPNWGPETAEHFVRNLAYAPNGLVSTPLESGNYDLTVSHGPEYNAEFTKLKIEHGTTTHLTVKLPRMVETPGWVSADFHSHSSPSGDNTGSQLGRVLNLAAENVEFAPCTEHNRISTYEHHIEALGLKPYLATVSGMELTGQPLPLNHQNVFPLVHRPRTQDGGAPVTDASPETQMERIAAWDNNSVKLIQQNHPDIGWLFYDKDGDQKPDEGYSRSFGLMNVTEIHPIDPLLNPTQFQIHDGKPTGNQTALNWLQLLNQGHRIYGVVNTDAHYNFHGSGGLRLWIKSSTDDPATISSDELRDASRSGNIIMSNGPYLEASFREGGTDTPPVIAGQDLVAKSKKVTASVKVQCPNWFDVDTVFVLVNGRRRDNLTFTRDSHPALFGSDVVKFQQGIEIELVEDAHLVVVTGHRTQLIGDVMGPFWGTQHPTALNNPVFVDIDGDGFTANKDTLDIPLPVKFVAAP